MAAGYLIEPSPTRSLDWQRPVGAFLSLKKGTEFKIPLHHLKAYGCKAYVHKPTATTRQLDRLDPKAHIGYLVSYESTNIYRIWIPVLSRAETTRDVRFDEDSFYDRHIGIIQDIDWIAEQLASITLWAPTQLQEDDIKSTAYAEPEDYLVRMVTLPQSMPTQPTQTAEALTPLKEDIVSENVNCLLTPTPTPSLRRQAYVAALEHDYSYQAFVTAFFTAIDHNKQRAHRTDLPDAPDGWKELANHSHAAGFKAAAAKEYNDLVSQNTFEPVTVNSIGTSKIIPVRWFLLRSLIQTIY